MNTAIAIRNSETGLNTLYWDRLRNVRAQRFIVRFTGKKWHQTEYVATVWAQSAVGAIRKAKHLLGDIPLYAIRNATSLDAVAA